MQITYDEFITGLYAIYHYEPLSSRSFVSTEDRQGNPMTFCEIVTMKVDSLEVLERLNPNMAGYFKLQAQGFYCEEIAKMLKISASTIKRYSERIIKILEEMTL